MIESQLAALFTRIADGEPAASRVDTQLAGAGPVWPAPRYWRPPSP